MLIWWFAGGFALLAVTLAVSACIAAGRSEMRLAAQAERAAAGACDPTRSYMRQEARP